MKKIIFIFAFFMALFPITTKAVQEMPSLHTTDLYNLVQVYAVVGRPYSEEIKMVEEGDFTFEIYEGELPSGLSLSEDGIISGTITTYDPEAYYDVIIKISDPTDEYAPEYAEREFIISDENAEWINLNNLYTTNETVDGALYDNGLMFAENYMASYYLSYDSVNRIYNVVLFHDLIDGPNVNVLSLALNGSEIGKLARLEILENVGFLEMQEDMLLQTVSCEDETQTCMIFRWLQADTTYTGTNRHIFAKFSNPSDSSQSIYVNYTIMDVRNHHVVFETNSNNHITSQELATGDKITKPTDPIKTGYVFDGWYRDSSLQNKWDFDTTITDENIVLYAKWKTAVQEFKTTDENNKFISQTPLNSSFIFYVDNVTKTNPYVENINELLSNQEVIQVVDIYLKDESNSIVQLSTGSYEVKIKLTDELLNYSNYKVGYLNPTTHTITEWFDTTIKDGYLTFTTTHLSEYVVLGDVPIINPETLDGIYIYITLATISLLCLTGVYVIIKKKNKKNIK